MQIIFAHAITTSTARASSVSPSGYTNTIFNQSARVRLYYDCFLKDNMKLETVISSHRYPKLSGHRQHDIV